MPLVGEGKKAYQREYMRKRRAGLTAGSNKRPKIGEKGLQEMKMVEIGGLEPPTSALRTLRSPS
jgi:hypothetical protein